MKTKKPSFWKTIWDALKEAKRTYKAQIEEVRDKHKLLSSHSDWTMLEKWIQECNKNPDLKVTIRLNDGTTMMLTCYRPQPLTADTLLSAITVEE